ncbi:hypothetical protein [Rhizobium sp. MHM7A]|uniref:hypothetical protein n=1 Tax=Rhizobium sp. MHM7A TaxID=2583233 RepID=UPI0011057728|nr:hypothetical protein [Rhizobium sp. MHM7A]TLX17017.1 hypothetical protein FFR93_06800 [Rhizobium sp. MHM7A]
MNEQEWAERRTVISDDLYEALLKEADCGPFDGGCLVVAQALQQVLGGDVVVLVRAQSGIADHAALLFDGMLWDFDGPLSPSAFVKRFQENELFGTGAKCGGFRLIEPGDLEDTPHNDRLVERLADIFRTILPDTEISPRP